MGQAVLSLPKDEDLDTNKALCRIIFVLVCCLMCDFALHPEVTVSKSPESLLSLVVLGIMLFASVVWGLQVQVSSPLLEQY